MKSVKQSKYVHVKQHKSARRGHDSRVFSCLKRHKAILVASLLRLLNAPFTSAMAVTVMAIAIALAGSFYVLVSNAQQLLSSLQTGNQISLFLHEQVSDQQAGKLAQQLRANQAVEKVTLISKQQALAEFKQYSGFGAALAALEGNPLPAVLQVYPKETVKEAYQLRQLVAQMQNQQAVDFAQMDMGWVTRLQSIMQIANRVVMLLSALLALAVVFITGNTIRSELQARHDEIVVTKLVGGTNAFICLPFLYTGFWYGVISGVLAWGIIFLMLIMIDAPLEQLSLLYQNQFQLHFLSISESTLLLLASAVLGIIGAFAVANHQLRTLKPE
ncbi:MAG: FtsX-like permease family protein [Methyloprofundus sp.]|nr:FtsX-like permease family protein [Methyloprofundus sp.]